MGHDALCAFLEWMLPSSVAFFFFNEGKHMEIQCLKEGVFEQSNFKEIRKYRLTWFKWNYLGIKLE